MEKKHLLLQNETYSVLECQRVTNPDKLHTAFHIPVKLSVLKAPTFKTFYFLFFGNYYPFNLSLTSSLIFTLL